MNWYRCEVIPSAVFPDTYIKILLYISPRDYQMFVVEIPKLIFSQFSIN